MRRRLPVGIPSFAKSRGEGRHCADQTPRIAEPLPVGECDFLSRSRRFGKTLSRYCDNPIAQYAGHYASVFCSHQAALGLDLTAEDASRQGQCDLVVRQARRIVLIGFELTEADTVAGEALAQLKARGYAAKHRGPGSVTLLGVTFSKTKRQKVGW